jgi:hypothetical protein
MTHPANRGEQEGNGMNWLCRIIGHKWVMKRRIAVDGLSVDRLLLFEACLRCGEPYPPQAPLDPYTTHEATRGVQSVSEVQTVNAAYAAEERAEAGEGDDHA